MKIKDLKKYFKLETGEIFETRKKMLNLWQPPKDRMESLIESSTGGVLMSFTIPVVATADSKEELENNDRKSD